MYCQEAAYETEKLKQINTKSLRPQAISIGHEMKVCWRILRTVANIKIKQSFGAIWSGGPRQISCSTIKIVERDSCGCKWLLHRHPQCVHFLSESCIYRKMEVDKINHEPKFSLSWRENKEKKKAPIYELEGRMYSHGCWRKEDYCTEFELLQCLGSPINSSPPLTKRGYAETFVIHSHFQFLAFASNPSISESTLAIHSLKMPVLNSLTFFLLHHNPSNC